MIGLGPTRKRVLRVSMDGQHSPTDRRAGPSPARTTPGLGSSLRSQTPFLLGHTERKLPGSLNQKAGSSVTCGRIRLVGGRVGAVPREHTSGRHEPRQLGRVVRLRLLGDGDARCSAATRRLPRLATDRYPDRMDRRRLLPTGFIEPCIPTRAHKPPSGPGWVHEVKGDGYRLIVRRDRAPVQPPRP